MFGRLLQAPQPPKAPEQDFDLDSLLTDLTSFNPSDVVAATHPQTDIEVQPEQVAVPPPQQTPSPATYSPAMYSPATRSPAHVPSPHITPVHNHSADTYTPPHTPGHSLARSYTEVSDPRGQRPSDERQRSFSQSSVGDSPKKVLDGESLPTHDNE